MRIEGGNRKRLDSGGNQDELYSQFSVVSSNLVSATPKQDGTIKLDKKKTMQIGTVTVESGPRAYASNMSRKFEDSLVI